ncbi:hypothetical protein HK098_002752 [Nowakowskiella sp. JEL0407]|nr:hypothetical protein HK098_002752 [Nowakowskiella sp. JEL0407]
MKYFILALVALTPLLTEALPPPTKPTLVLPPAVSKNITKLEILPKGNATRPSLYGVFYENLNYAGDGGIYAELIRNRAFQGNYKAPPSTAFWTSTSNVDFTLVNSTTSVSPSLTLALRTTTKPGKVAGLTNPGWWGIDVVKGRKYKGSFYARLESGKAPAVITASLESNSTSKVYASANVDVKLTGKWKKFEYEFTANANGIRATDNVFTLKWKADAAVVIDFNLISLFPPTYKNRPNGLRPDLVEVLKDLKPAFLRFPGGTDVQGDTVFDRLKWEDTVGPIENRVGRFGSWGYYQTAGLGLLEYMQLCEDLNADAIMGVYFAYSIKWGANGQEEDAVPEAEIGPYVQSVLNQIEYVMGSTSTKYGALRASHGREKPFKLKYVELGNEDWAGPVGRSTHGYRFRAFYGAIKQKYPQLVIIGTTPDGITFPKGVVYDQHFYRRPSNWIDMFNTFDSWPRNGTTVFVGEYASIQADETGNPEGDPNKPIDWSSTGVRLPFPSMKGTVGEAIFAFGFERNQDAVEFASYAPLFQNANNKGWTPDLIQFDADPKNTVLSTSYYLQKLLSYNLGTESLPIKTTNAFHPLYWVASYDKPSDSYILKLANFGEKPATVQACFPKKVADGAVTTLSAEANAYNTPEKKSIVPVISHVVVDYATDKCAVIPVPKWSVQVARFELLGF